MVYATAMLGKGNAPSEVVAVRTFLGTIMVVLLTFEIRFERPVVLYIVKSRPFHYVRVCAITSNLQR